MDKFLLFQLYAPLVSWGDIAMGEERPSYPHPSKSAIAGLLSASLGIKREEEDRLKAVADGYSLAVFVDSAGSLLRDYHTSQVPPQKALKGYSIRTRKDELDALASYQKEQSKSIGTILSTREYRCDAYYRVAISAKENCPYTLEELCEALKKPKFHLYFGRKSCPPARPLDATIVSAKTVKSAFEIKLFEEFPFMDDSLSIYWEDGIDSGFEASKTFTRRDIPTSRRQWQFDERDEHHAIHKREV